MEEALLLTSISLFTLLAGVCSIVFNKAKLPPLIGYLVAGIVIANIFTVSETGTAAIEMLSDFGLVLLMFCIGLEVNIRKIRKQGVFAITVAVVQLPLMVVGGIAAGTLMGYDPVQSIALGAIISGSSTAVVMAVLKSQEKLSKEQIDMLVLITIMEDIGQVVMLSMLTPVLAGSTMEVTNLVVLIASIAVFMIASLAVGLKIIPRMVNWVSDNVTPEIVIVFSVGLAFGMAWLASIAGLSMAIGAFLMGMLMSGCRKTKEISEAVEPMKSLFMAMFFISVGMEVHLATLSGNIPTMLMFYALFAVLKTATVLLGYWVGGESGRNGFISAVSLTAMGEFAFIISKEALDYGVVGEGFYTSVIGAALLSMVSLPLLTRFSERIWDGCSGRCPGFLRKAIRSADSIRDSMYIGFRTATKKSKKTILKGMADAYTDALVILVIEVVFYAAVPIAGPMLADAFGGDLRLWYFALVMLNFVVLIPPISYLVMSIREVEDVIVRNTRRLVEMDGEEDPIRRGDKYRKYLEMTTLLTVVLIDLLLIAVVPNPLGLAEHLYVVAAAAVIVVVLYRRMSRRRPFAGGAGPEDDSEASDEDSAPGYEEEMVRDVGTKPGP
ncbi:MAG: cation:proton antiporter [Candidatus Methanomethylophilaceae archaeon]|nr:cation:proton antiporter [Candidatus Methanomethylophilaceae archaeon]